MLVLLSSTFLELCYIYLLSPASNVITNNPRFENESLSGILNLYPSFPLTVRKWSSSAKFVVFHTFVMIDDSGWIFFQMMNANTFLALKTTPCESTQHQSFVSHIKTAYFHLVKRSLFDSLGQSLTVLISCISSVWMRIRQKRLFQMSSITIMSFPLADVIKGYTFFRPCSDACQGFGTSTVRVRCCPSQIGLVLPWH